MQFYQLINFLREYAVLILIVLLMIILSLASDAFLSPRNLLNILNQNAPLAIIAAALTLCIIAGGFDLSTASVFGVASCAAAWIAVNVDPLLGLALAPLLGVILGYINGVLITSLGVHSFLATIATSLIYRGIAILITGGFLIPVRMQEFVWLGRGKIYGIHYTVFILIIFTILMTIILNRTTFGRNVFAVGGNEEAAKLSGIRVNLITIYTFALTGLAAGLAGAIQVSRISLGQPQAGLGMELQAIAAVILGGTSIYGGHGAVWRSVAGVMVLALINNGFNILNADPFWKDVTTGVIIFGAVALTAGRKR
ncbi:MAG: Ribose import permease protein RbsC [Alphaproteobacteria bacterium MarineAlpha5_Bin9]|nr:MAG: Ribose import permease protein RbsC [Alphaproteobacteria bacterium MarineAlpha5_Bin9]|tara:strand:+ start:33437 stop:34369 length:933 start_codon:yes stop_codon:yes gene_type:complete